MCLPVWRGHRTEWQTLVVDKSDPCACGRARTSATVLPLCVKFQLLPIVQGTEELSPAVLAKRIHTPYCFAVSANNFTYRVLLVMHFKDLQAAGN